MRNTKQEQNFATKELTKNDLNNLNDACFVFVILFS